MGRWIDRKINRQEDMHLPTPYRNWWDNRPVKVILLAADHEARTAPRDATQRLCAILEISRLCAAAPELDPCSVDEIIGYAANGLPT